MINNDYVRGYFDAHGLIYKHTDPKGYEYWRISFQESNDAQLWRVVRYLTDKGYHLSNGRYGRDTTRGHTTTYKAELCRQAEVKRFAEEIGTERPEWQERFNELGTN